MYKDSARVIPAKSLKPKINPKIVSAEQITKLIVDKNNFISFRGGYDWTLAKKHLPSFEISAKANNNFVMLRKVIKMQYVLIAEKPICLQVEFSRIHEDIYDEDILVGNTLKELEARRIDTLVVDPKYAHKVNGSFMR